MAEGTTELVLVGNISCYNKLSPKLSAFASDCLFLAHCKPNADIASQQAACPVAM